jgi:hypothetical protein
MDSLVHMCTVVSELWQIGNPQTDQVAHASFLPLSGLLGPPPYEGLVMEKLVMGRGQEVTRWRPSPQWRADEGG